MNKNLLVLIILLFLFSTVLVCVYKPKTHKPIMFENRDFKLELISNESVAKNNSEVDLNFTPININMPDVNIDVPEISTSSTKIVQKENIPSQKSETKNNVSQKQKTQIVSKNISEKKVEKIVQKQQENISDKIEKDVTKPVLVENSQKNENIVAKNLPSEKTETPKFLTEEEEIIAWNKWRSDLQNKLMSDSKIAAPIGTTFAFSFTVDKFGTISNLKTWSTNPSYTPLAVRVIKPLLLSYQKTAILNFPIGSKRVITNVDGGFTMARSSRYSSPSDYNDYERVTK